MNPIANTAATPRISPVAKAKPATTEVAEKTGLMRSDQEDRKSKAKPVEETLSLTVDKIDSASLFAAVARRETAAAPHPEKPKTTLEFNEPEIRTEPLSDTPANQVK